MAGRTKSQVLADTFIRAGFTRKKHPSINRTAAWVLQGDGVLLWLRDYDGDPPTLLDARIIVSMCHDKPGSGALTEICRVSFSGMADFSLRFSKGGEEGAGAAPASK